MIRVIVTLLLFVVASKSVFAQREQMLSVYYLSKDYTSETNVLCAEIKEIYSSALRDPSQAVVFYVPNSTSPQIVKINLPGDNREDMDKVFEALITKNETIIDPSTDLKSIVNLFDSIPLLNSSGEKIFLNVELYFYITPAFWELRYNESIVSSAYFALDFGGSWAKDYCSMSIYHCSSDGLVVDEKLPFGFKNLCPEYKFLLLSY